MTVTPIGEKFVVIRHNVIRAGLSPQAFTLYAALVMYADYDTGETYVARQTLAGFIGAKQPRSVDRYVRELVDAELVTDVRHRWTTQRRDMADVVFAKDDAHPVQTSSLYVVNLRPESPQVTAPPVESPQVAPLCATAHGGGALQRTGVVRQNAHNQEPLTNNPSTESENHSVDAVARIAESVDGSKPEPAELPADWAPGKFHRSKAERLGIDVDAAGAYFADEMRADGERRRDWGSTFGAFLDEIGAGTVETTFGMRDPQDVAVEASVTAWIADNTPEPEPVEHVAPVAAPRRVGYTADVVAGIEWVEGILGRLSDTERVMAGDLLTAGVMRSEVWTEVENARERTAAAA